MNKGLGIIQSRNKQNINFIQVIDYYIDQKNNNDVMLTFLYKNAKYTAKIQTLITDKYDLPIHFGDRYIVIDNHVYFIDDFENYAGITSDIN